MRVGLGDLGLGDLRGVGQGKGQGRVDVRWREEGLVLGVEGDGLEGGRGLAVAIVHHGVALVVVPAQCGVWEGGMEGGRHREGGCVGRWRVWVVWMMSVCVCVCVCMRVCACVRMRWSSIGSGVGVWKGC